MARILLVVVVCYCAYCAQVATGKENVLRQNQINENANFDPDKSFKAYAKTTDPEAIHELPNNLIEDSVLSKQRDRRKPLHPIESDRSSLGLNLGRDKRHAGGHGHHETDADDEAKENAALFVKKLFEQFGDGDRLTMNVVGFEKMLKHLGLYRLIEDNHPVPTPKVGEATGTNKPARSNETVSLLF